MAFDYAEYLKNLLIIQYTGKPKASATIKAVAKMFPVDLIFAVRDGFNLETATGKQLDILAKYIQASRSYTDSHGNHALLTDDEFRSLLKMKLISNNGDASLYDIESRLYDLFGDKIRVVDDVNGSGHHIMMLSYFINEDMANVGLAATQQNLLPHPTGVGSRYSEKASTVYFGFIDYLNQNHPHSTGFLDYSDPDKEGEMYGYDKLLP